MKWRGTYGFYCNFKSDSFKISHLNSCFKCRFCNLKFIDECFWPHKRHPKKELIFKSTLSIRISCKAIYKTWRFSQWDKQISAFRPLRGPFRQLKLQNFFSLNLVLVQRKYFSVLKRRRKYFFIAIGAIIAKKFFSKAKKGARKDSAWSLYVLRRS